MSDVVPPSVPPFVLVTGNPGKLLEARRFLAQAVSGFHLEHQSIDLPEIQSLDLLTVLEAKADEAWRRLQKPVVVDETGLGLASMGGFPGPLIKWLLDSVGAAGLGSMAHRLGDPRATACCALMYFDGERRLVGESAVDGHLLAEPAGEHGFGWDPIFVPAGQPVSYAQMSDETKDRIGHRGDAWRQLLDRLQHAP